MRRGCTVGLLVLSIVCFILFWSTDFATSAVARHLLQRKIKGFFEGDCSNEGQDRQVRNALSPSLSFSPTFTVSERLSGLHLNVLIRPFRLEDKDGNITYIEMGPFALKVEMEGKLMWIMHDSNHSNMTAEEPINNVNLLTILTPLMAEQIVPGLPPGAFPELSANLQNKSIIDRVTTVQNITDTIMNLYNFTVDNSLKQIHSFLAAGDDTALVYNGFSLELGKRYSNTKNKTVWSLPPFLNKPVHYSLPRFKELSFEYLHSNEPSVAGLLLDKYKTNDIWNSSILCHLTSRSLLDFYKKVQQYRVYLTAPATTLSKNFDLITQTVPFAATLDVYRPFALPVGGSISVQMNFHIPKDEGLIDVLQGDTTPVVVLTATLEQLPDKERKALVTLIRARTAVLLTFLVLSCVFLVTAVTSFITYRQPRRRRTWTFHDVTL